MIKNLIFDFGKVLVDYDFDVFFNGYIADEQRRRDFIPLFYNVEMQEAFDREVTPIEEIAEGVRQRYPHFEHEIHLFIEHYHEMVTGEIEGMYPLLQQLKQEGYRLYGLTNWCSRVYKTIEQFPIFSLLDGWVISSEEKSIKPEPAIYNRLYEKFGLNPAECLFADDKAVNIEGGRHTGMDGIVFENAQQYEQELRKRL